MQPATRRDAEALEETHLALRRVMAATKGRFHAVLGQHGLTFPQWLVLKSLGRKGRLTAKEIADLLESTPANVTGILDRLERDGLVTRSKSAEDRRVVHVRLTEEGHARIGAVIGVATRVLSEMFEGWTHEELAELRALLARVRLRPEDQVEF